MTRFPACVELASKHRPLLNATYSTNKSKRNKGRIIVTFLCWLAFCLRATAEIQPSRVMDSKAPFQGRSLDRGHYTLQKKKKSLF